MTTDRCVTNVLCKINYLFDHRKVFKKLTLKKSNLKHLYLHNKNNLDTGSNFVDQ